LPYDDHERALKLLHTLDQKVWDVKVLAIIESPNYETITMDELFSKVKSTEIENPLALTMALISGTGGSSSFANPSQATFPLSSLVSVIEERWKHLGTMS